MSRNIDIDAWREEGGCAWALTALDPSGGKPTYASVSSEDLCFYPLLTDVLDTQQLQVIFKACAAQQPEHTARDESQGRQMARRGPEQLRPAPAPPGRTVIPTAAIPGEPQRSLAV